MRHSHKEAAATLEAEKQSSGNAYEFSSPEDSYSTFVQDTQEIILSHLSYRSPTSVWVFKAIRKNNIALMGWIVAATSSLQIYYKTWALEF